MNGIEDFDAPPINTSMTLSDCLEYLNTDNYMMPLPCREKEIEVIAKFINDTLMSDPPNLDAHRRGRKPKVQKPEIFPTILFISGNPGTGKTASVKFCVTQSPYPSLIRYVNCKAEKLNLFTAKDEVPRILIIDEVESGPDFAEISTNCRYRGYSLICISNAHEDDTILSKSSGLPINQLKFNSYTEKDIVDILVERTGGPCDCLKLPALQHLAKVVLKDRGDARAAIGKLNAVLGSAIQQGIENIDLATMAKIISSQSTRIEFEMPFYQQVALVAIHKSGKDWVKTFQEICAQKHVDSYPDIKSLFQALSDYQGLIKGTFRNPQTIISRDVIRSSVDDALLYAIPE